MDGSRPGIFQYPLRTEIMTTFGLRTVVYHETVPGHHFDIAQQVENKGLPAFRQLGTFGGTPARTEGWGLYAEHLAAESGWYENDLEGLLGQLSWELFRAPWSSIPDCTRNTGRGSKRSITALRLRKSSAMSFGPARRPPRRSAN